MGILRKKEILKYKIAWDRSGIVDHRENNCSVRNKICYNRGNNGHVNRKKKKIRQQI